MSVTEWQIWELAKTPLLLLLLFVYIYHCTLLAIINTILQVESRKQRNIYWTGIDPATSGWTFRRSTNWDSYNPGHISFAPTPRPPFNVGSCCAVCASNDIERGSRGMKAGICLASPGPRIVALIMLVFSFVSIFILCPLWLIAWLIYCIFKPKFSTGLACLKLQP